MAEENIIFNTQINTGNSATSIKSVRAELRELTQQMAGMDVGSEAFVRAAQRAGELQDRMQDAQAAVKAFNPEAKFQAFATVLGGVANGFAAAQGAMAIFGSDSKELEKMMQKTQGAIALATGINGLLGMKDGFIMLGSQLIKMIPALKSFGAAAVGALTGGIATAIILIISYWEDLKSLVTGTTAAVKLSSEQIAESVKKGHDEFKKAAQERNEIAKREAQTKLQGRELDLELAKIDRKNKREQAQGDGKLREQQALIEAEYRKAVLDINKKYDKEEADRRKKKEDEASKKLFELEAKQAEANDEAFKKNTEKLIKDREKAFKSEVKQAEEQDRLRRLRLAKQLTADVITKEQYDAKLVESENMKNAAIVAAGEKNYQDVSAQQKALAEAEVAAALNKTKTKEQLRGEELEAEQWYANSTMSIINDLGNAMGANAETMKAIAVAQTTIDTYFAAQKAYASQMSLTTPDAPIRAVIAASVAVAAGLARVAAIVRVPARGNVGGGSPSGGGGGSPAAPALPPPSSATRLTNGNEPIITRELNVKENRVYVLEKDITKKQDDVAGIVNKATIQ
jgi:hypothetical protein